MKNILRTRVSGWQVRLKAQSVWEVKVLLGHTLSGP